jgi:hypothetical protein
VPRRAPPVAIQVQATEPHGLRNIVGTRTTQEHGVWICKIIHDILLRENPGKSKLKAMIFTIMPVEKH